MALDRKQAKLQRRMHRKEKEEEDARRAGFIRSLLRRIGLGAPPTELPKMSDALEQVARPMLDSMPASAGLTGMTQALLAAAASWNAAVTHPPEETESALQGIARLISKDSPRLGELLLPYLRLMAERKRLLFPREERLVLDVNVEDRGDHFYFTVASAPWERGSSLGSR